MLLVNDPPAPPSDHIAEVAVPPNEPPRAVVVPPWQTAATPGPAFADGDCMVIEVAVVEAEPQPPVLVTEHE